VITLAIYWLIFPWLMISKFNQLLKLQGETAEHLRRMRAAYEAQVKQVSGA
jgi:hypothetical protein